LLRIPTITPEIPSRTTIGKRTRESPIASWRSPPGLPKGAITSGAMTMKNAVRAPSPSSISQKRLEATRQARFRSPFSRSSLKTGTNRRGERGVCDERADEVRHLEGDRECVDLPGGAEVVRGDDLANEPENPGDAGGEREDRRRPRQPSAAGRALLVHASEYRNVLRRHRLFRPCPFGPWCRAGSPASSPLRA